MKSCDCNDTGPSLLSPLQGPLCERACCRSTSDRRFSQRKAYRDIGSRYTLRCSFFLEDKIPNVAVFVSKYDHCLYDILTQQRSGKLACTIPFILSNHKDLESVAKQFQIPFYHVPVTKEMKAEAETRYRNVHTTRLCGYAWSYWR